MLGLGAWRYVGRGGPEDGLLPASSLTTLADMAMWGGELLVLLKGALAWGEGGAGGDATTRPLLLPGSMPVVVGGGGGDGCLLLPSMPAPRVDGAPPPPPRPPLISDKMREDGENRPALLPDAACRRRGRKLPEASAVLLASQGATAACTEARMVSARWAAVAWLSGAPLLPEGPPAPAPAPERRCWGPSGERGGER